MEGQNYGELSGRYQIEIAHKDQRISELEAELANVNAELEMTRKISDQFEMQKNCSNEIIEQMGKRIAELEAQLAKTRG